MLIRTNAAGFVPCWKKVSIQQYRCIRSDAWKKILSKAILWRHWFWSASTTTIPFFIRIWSPWREFTQDSWPIRSGVIILQCSNTHARILNCVLLRGVLNPKWNTDSITTGKHDENLQEIKLTMSFYVFWAGIWWTNKSMRFVCFSDTIIERINKHCNYKRLCVYEFRTHF